MESGCQGRTGLVIPIWFITAISYFLLHPPRLTHTQSVHGADGLGNTWSAPHVGTPMPHVMRRPGQSLFQRSTLVILDRTGRKTRKVREEQMKMFLKELFSISV
jgi:hypothetical protein